MWLKQFWFSWVISSTHVAETGLYSKKVLLYIWWDWKVVIDYVLLLTNKAIKSEKYCSQLGKRKPIIIRQWLDLANRWDVVFRNDNIRPHAFLAIINTLLAFDWNAMPYPLCSPDIAPSDYCNFIFYQNFSLPLPPPPEKPLWMTWKMTSPSFLPVNQKVLKRRHYLRDEEMEEGC